MKFELVLNQTKHTKFCKKIVPFDFHSESSSVIGYV